MQSPCQKRLSHWFNGNNPVVGSRLNPVFIEHIDTSAADPRCIVVQIERISVGQRLQLICELALGQVIG